MACFTRAVIPATWGAAMEVPPHELILIGLAHCAVDGVDVAARGRDFRLQAQIARHTPGAK